MGCSIASEKKWTVMRTHTNHIIPGIFLFISIIQYSSSSAQLNSFKKDTRQNVLSIAYFIESASNSINSLNGLLKKDNYRNKISSLNNPTNNELGFSLKNEILTALKPLLAKAKHTDGKKFKEVIENFLNNPEDNGISSVKKYLPTLGIFSTVLSLVGNLVIAEKNISQDDLNQFIVQIQQYFSQYEKLNAINEQFGTEVQKLLDRCAEIKQDLKDFLLECITTMNKDLSRTALKDLSVEALIQRYYDPLKLQDWLDTSKVKVEGLFYPPDAPTSVKLLTASIKKLQKEFETVYFDNHKELKELIASLKIILPDLDQNQLTKTNNEIDQLYNESRQADVINLNISQVDERMNAVCKNINGK
jgi:hypothetical protein